MYNISDVIFCCQLRVCEDTVCPLLSAGVMFQMPDIVKSCCTFLEHQLDPSESSHLLACSALLNFLCFHQIL